MSIYLTFALVCFHMVKYMNKSTSICAYNMFNVFPSKKKKKHILPLFEAWHCKLEYNNFFFQKINRINKIIVKGKRNPIPQTVSC